MWPFNRKTLDEQRLRETLARYLSQDALDEILADPDRQAHPPQPWRFAYILLQVSDGDLEQAPQHLNTAMEIIARRDGYVSDVLSTLILATFGLPLVDEDLDKARDQQAKAVARLVTELGAQMRLVHGIADGLAGNIGAQGTHYGVLLPDLSRGLAALMALEFGKAAEV